MRKAKAFTLTELLVVIAIITIVAILAVPSFRALTGGRSTEAAQNTISAVLSRARTEALGLEEPRGVLFYRDLETQRVGMMVVKPSNTTPPYELDLVPDREAVLLPQGVGIQFIDDDNPTVTGDEDRYIGFNTLAGPGNTTVVPYGGVVLFDRKGQVTTDAYAFRIRYATPMPRAAEMGRFLLNNPNLPTGGTQAFIPPNAASKLGFVLYDDSEFQDVNGQGRTGAKNADTDNQLEGTTGNGPFGAAATPLTEAAEEQWLNDNAVPVLVNRYNGTLIRGE